MKIQGEKEALVDVGQAVGRVVSQRATIPALAGIRITAGGAGVEFAATDMELFITVRGDFLVEDEGSVVVPGRLFGDILRSLPMGRVTVEGREAEGRVWIKAGQSEFSVAALRVDDFPVAPEVSEVRLARVEGGQLAKALRQVVRAVSTDEGRPVLTGALWSMEGEVLRLVATDSYRLAVREVVVKEGSGDGEAIIPGRALGEFARHLGGEETAAVWLGDAQGVFESGRTRMVTRLIDGRFPDYRQLIPSSYPNRLVVQREGLARAVERMGLVARANTPLKLHLGDDVMLTATQTGVADASETVDGGDYVGEPMIIGFNPRFFADGLEELEAEQVLIELVDPGRPAIIRGEGREEFMYLLMPVRLWS